MMRGRLAGAWPVLVMLVLAGQVATASGGGLREILQAKYDASCAAEMRKDVKGTFAICAPEWVYVNQKGKTTSLAESLSTWGPRFQQCERIKASDRILSLQRTGPDSARVDTLSFNEYHVVDRSGQKHVMMTRSRDRDIWQHRNGDWWMVHSQTLSSQEYFDGKPR